MASTPSSTTLEPSFGGSSGGGSFPLNSIKVLEAGSGYTKWREEIDDWMILNNLYPFTEATVLKASVVIRYRLGYNGRSLIKDVDKDPQVMLDKIAANYKPKGSGLYTELVRQLHGITITTEGGVR